MLDDQDPATAHIADLSYAIASARAVVMALIVRDRDAAEEAALRTCRDCDLLIRLIRDLAAVLRTNDLNQLTCSQGELVWLARRAEYVLTFVGAPRPEGQSSRFRSASGDSGRTSVVQQYERTTPQMPDRVTTHSASASLTVASTGLRVRLVPLDRCEAGISLHSDGEHHHCAPEGEAPTEPNER
jgi:hypothetical protein